MEGKAWFSKNFRTEYREINSKFIRSDSNYQRPLDKKRVMDIVNNYDPNMVNPLKVSKRNGNKEEYYLIDGQHTFKALQIINGGRDFMVYCLIYYGMSPEEEAQMFARQSEYKRPITVRQKTRALLAGKDEGTLEMQRAIEKAGLEFSPIKARGDGKIGCTSLLSDIISKHGSAYLTDLLQLLVTIWNKSASSLRIEIVSGMNVFLEMYGEDPNFDRSRLIKVLQVLPPSNIVSKGKDFSIINRLKYAKAIWVIYNRGLRTKKLPDKFD